MARLDLRHPDNASGDWYVDERCIDCGTCRELSPAQFGTTSDQSMFQATADVLENTGVHAYLGQVPNIKTKAVLVGAGRILPVEARHAAWIRDIRFQGGTTSAETPAPGAFEDGFTKAAILKIVDGTHFIVA